MDSQIRVLYRASDSSSEEASLALEGRSTCISTGGGSAFSIILDLAICEDHELQLGFLYHEQIRKPYVYLKEHTIAYSHPSMT